MLLSLAVSILMVPVLLIDSLEDSETSGLLHEFDTPIAQPARALRWYTSDETPDAAIARDCSSTMMPPRLGKVRARWGDSCEVREGGPPENIQREPIPWRIPASFRIPVYDPIFNGKNPFCVIHSHGRLPLAICDSGDINQRYHSDRGIFTSFIESPHQFPTYRLEYCTLGMCHLVRKRSQVSDSPTRSTTIVHQLLTPSVCSLVLQII